ncbi:MAG: PrsW family intramembrane metalloprotease [Actinobacteria bacterium]|nr:PrsW family intramembrane metalloprotease [Actinomycetota bacterium]
MRCEHCGGENPELARFCWRCGRGLARVAAPPTRSARAYAIQPSENVTQLALISTLLPHTNRGVADDYRWAFVVGMGATLFLTVVGLLPAAVVMAAFLLPVAYLVYMHDVDLWEGRPGLVSGALYLLTGALAVVITLAFFRWLFADAFGGLLFTGGDRGGLGALPLGSVALFAVGLPVVAEIAKQIGPLLLVRRPEFDDMIDGFTFGAASGIAYSAFETIIAFGTVFSAAGLLNTDSLGTWLVVMVNLMLLKPVVYGAATGVAVAGYSGKGEGYDGFTGHYVGELLFAIAANVLYWVGIRLLAPAPFGAALGLFWGALVAAGLLVRARIVLQTALLEAAIEDAARDARPKWATSEIGYCPECENALLPDAAFCVVCGSSVRATSGGARRAIRSPQSERGGAT